MTLIFNIEYRTSWGEEVRVSGSIPELGNEHPDQASPLHTVDGIHWTAEVGIALPETDVSNTATISSRRPNHTRRVEQPATHLHLSGTSEESLPHTGLLEKSARTAVFLYFRLSQNLCWHIANAAPPQRPQERAVDKGVFPLHRQRPLSGTLRKPEGAG